MANEETITATGIVVEPLPNMTFRVEMANQHQVLARVSRKMKHWVRLLPGDCVVIKLSPKDPNRGHIVSRC